MSSWKKSKKLFLTVFIVILMTFTWVAAPFVFAEGDDPESTPTTTTTTEAPTTTTKAPTTTTTTTRGTFSTTSSKREPVTTTKDDMPEPSSIDAPTTTATTSATSPSGIIYGPGTTSVENDKIAVNISFSESIPVIFGSTAEELKTDSKFLLDKSTYNSLTSNSSLSLMVLASDSTSIVSEEAIEKAFKEDKDLKKIKANTTRRSIFKLSLIFQRPDSDAFGYAPTEIGVPTPVTAKLPVPKSIQGKDFSVVAALIDANGDLTLLETDVENNIATFEMNDLGNVTLIGIPSALGSSGKIPTLAIVFFIVAAIMLIGAGFLIYFFYIRKKGDDDEYDEDEYYDDEYDDSDDDEYYDEHSKDKSSKKGRSRNGRDGRDKRYRDEDDEQEEIDEPNEHQVNRQPSKPARPVPSAGGTFSGETKHFSIPKKDASPQSQKQNVSDEITISKAELEAREKRMYEEILEKIQSEQNKNQTDNKKNQTDNKKNIDFDL